MSLRETLRDSAREANERALQATQAAPPPTDSTVSLELRAIRTALAELRATLEASQPKRSTSLGIPRGMRPTNGLLAWILVGALLALIGMTLARPDWALRPRQQAELLLGAKLFERLQVLPEAERLELLRSLWEEAPPKTD